MSIPKITQFNLEQLKSSDWYRQETESTPYFILGPAYAAVHSQQAPYAFIFDSQEYDMRAYYSTTYMRNTAEKALEDERNNPGYFDKQLSDWNKHVLNAGRTLFQQLEAEPLESVTDEQLLSYNKQLSALSYKMWGYFYMEVFDIDAESLMEEELVEAGLTLTDQERSTLMMQEQLIVHQRSERALLKLVKMFQSTPGALNTLSHIQTAANIHRLQLYPHIEQRIDEYIRDFFWMYNSWARTSTIRPFDVVEQIKHILATNRDIDTEYEQLDNFENRILSEKAAIADAHNFSAWLRRLFHFFGLLVYWRDARKAEMQKQNYWHEEIGKEIARRSNRKWEEVRLLDPAAITELPVPQDILDTYADIARSHPICSWDGESFVAAKNSAEVKATIEEIIERDTTEIRGMIACPGKATGQVVVIRGENDFDKMVDGAVLVTTMTRPEFVPLMKRATAIVTDEGGITSHAAVVSRELKVPCVIGTQVATQKLNDGDTVLVNANHGVVIVQE